MVENELLHISGKAGKVVCLETARELPLQYAADMHIHRESLAMV